MGVSVKTKESPVMLVHGDESLLVRQRAAVVYARWCEEAGGMDHEVVDGGAGNADEAMRSIARLREALQTLPFFGGSKVVWWRGCDFFGDERTAGSAAVTEALAELAPELVAFRWDGVRLVISAGRMDKRRVFYKTLEKLAAVEECNGLSADMRDWVERAEGQVLEWLRARGKEIQAEALAAFVAGVGPNLSLLQSEAEKLATYVGERGRIMVDDVGTITVRNKQARAFALGDALGERDIPRLLQALDGELWVVKGDKERSEIGLLYGLVGKVRSMLLAKELVRERWVTLGGEYGRFKEQLQALPPGRLPEDRRYNPAAINAYVLFRAAGQSRNWTEAELVGALERLLDCNLRLVSSGQEAGLVLQRTLLELVRR